MDIRVSSFGFKHGVPMEADLVLDVRFLPNPYYVADLRPLTGLDQGVRDYVFHGGQAEEFLERLWALVGWLLPRYEEEGKTALVIAVGCTGGHHRSVAIAHALAERIRGQGWPVAESHRLGKKLMAGAVAWIRDTEQVCPFRERSGYERYVAQPPAVGAGAQDRRCGRRYGPFHHAARLKKIYQESDRHRHCGG